MTLDEQDRIVGRLRRERATARRELAKLRDKIIAEAESLEKTGRLLADASRGDAHQARLTWLRLTLPDLGEMGGWFDVLEIAGERLADLEARLAEFD